MGGATTADQDEGAATCCKAHISRARNEASLDDRRPLLVCSSILGRGSLALCVLIGHKTTGLEWVERTAQFWHIRESSTLRLHLPEDEMEKADPVDLSL